MRRRFIVRSLAALALAPAAAVGKLRAFAQEATPPAGGDGLPEGVAARVVASGWVDLTSPGRANMNLGRITLAPGTSAPFGGGGAAALVFVSAGELTFRVGAPVTVARRTDPGTPVPPPEPFEADTDFTLSDGDSSFFLPGVAGDVRNDGEEEAAAWVVTLAVTAADAGTPAP